VARVGRGRTLTDKQELFCRHYAVSRCATDAAKAAGYDTKNTKQVGYALLTDPRIIDRITELAAPTEMSAHEVVERLTAQARAPGADYIKADAKGELYFDIKGLQADGLAHIVRRFTISSGGRIQVEFYDAQEALVILGKSLGVLTERTTTEQGRGEKFRRFTEMMLAARRGSEPMENPDEGDDAVQPGEGD
jgi:hypothetical protein